MSATVDTVLESLIGTTTTVQSHRSSLPVETVKSTKSIDREAILASSARILDQVRRTREQRTISPSDHRQQQPLTPPPSPAAALSAEIEEIDTNRLPTTTDEHSKSIINQQQSTEDDRIIETSSQHESEENPTSPSAAATMTEVVSSRLPATASAQNNG